MSMRNSIRETVYTSIERVKHPDCPFKVKSREKDTLLSDKAASIMASLRDKFPDIPGVQYWTSGMSDHASPYWRACENLESLYEALLWIAAD